MARKKQNGNGQGTVYPRKNRHGKIIGYRGSYFAPDGKRRYVSAKRKGDAETALRRAMTDADRGFVFEAGTVTLEEYLTCWLKDSVKDTVRRSTFAQYESVVRRHLIPALGRVRLKALNPAHARSLYREKLDSGLSPRTVQYVHVTLHKALKQAVMDGLIPRNVADAVKAPQAHRERGRLHDPRGGRGTALRGLRGPFGGPLYRRRAHGSAEGELLGLKWPDVDLDSGTLSVQRSLDKDGRSTRPSATRAAAPSSSRGRPWKSSRVTAFARTGNGCGSAPSGRITAWCSPTGSGSR